jgi:hypothetical protein
METDGGAGGCTPRAGKVGPRSNPGPYFLILKSEQCCSANQNTAMNCALALPHRLTPQLVTEGVAFPHFKPGNSYDQRRKMQTTRDSVQGTGVVG